MPTENKKTTLSENSPKKIDYVMQTMETDLKNEKPKNSSFDFSQKTTPKPKIDETKIIKKTKEPKKVIRGKESSNPFLENIGKPTPTNVFTGTPKEKENKPLNVSSFKNKSITPIVPDISNPKKSPKKTTSIDSKLLLVLLLVSLIAIGASIYYLYFIKKPTVEGPSLITPEPTTSMEKIPEKLKNSETLSFNPKETSLVTLLLGKKALISNSLGTYYQIKQADTILNSSELLNLLEIQLPKEISNELNQAWVFIYPLEDTLKMSLVLKTTENQELIKTFFNKNESRLPELLKPLFIDESFILKDELIIFAKSKDLKNIRYYNFVEADFSKAIDWGITDNNYLILTTSKETALKITKDLRINANLSDNSEKNVENTPIN